MANGGHLEGTVRALEGLNYLFAIFGVIIALITLVQGVQELREGNQIRKAENAQKLVEMTTTYNMAFVTDPTLFSLWQAANEGDGEGYDSLGKEEDKARFRQLWVAYLNILENAYYQKKKGLIDEDIYGIYETDISRNKTILSRFWDRGDKKISGFYSEEFKKHVTTIIEGGATPDPRVKGATPKSKSDAATPDSRKTAP